MLRYTSIILLAICPACPSLSVTQQSRPEGARIFIYDHWTDKVTNAVVDSWSLRNGIQSVPVSLVLPPRNLLARAEFDIFYQWRLTPGYPVMIRLSRVRSLDGSAWSWSRDEGYGRYVVCCTFPVHGFFHVTFHDMHRRKVMMNGKIINLLSATRETSHETENVYAESGTESFPAGTTTVAMAGHEIAIMSSSAYSFMIDSDGWGGTRLSTADGLVHTEIRVGGEDWQSFDRGPWEQQFDVPELECRFSSATGDEASVVIRKLGRLDEPWWLREDLLLRVSYGERAEEQAR